MSRRIIRTAACAAALAIAAPAYAQHANHDAKAPAGKSGDQALIESAMHAAPMRVSQKATIVAADDKGGMRTLRQGDNGFTCMPDNPATPGHDPMCMDAAALEWAKAWMGHQAPAAGRVGFMYMLAGGTDASNTDPYATRPTAENHWVETGPHVMVVGADAAFYDQYPKDAQPDTAVPYVMWAGTPYQHLMIPVKVGGDGRRDGHVRAADRGAASRNAHYGLGRAAS